MKYDKVTDFYTDGDKDHDLFLLFSRARYMVFRAREKELQKCGITPEQSQILFVSQGLDGQVTPAEIARLYQLKRHTVSSMVARMEKMGYVKRVRDLKRKNMIRVTITEKGRQYYESSLKRESIHRIMNVLNEKDRDHFIKCLKKIITRAQEEPF
ncbi:MAG: MarR family transcriptional regulator [Dehalococcoidales bacterium]|nr:MarR family transcriptional regulator [Dehalococcoidales bacterium]